MLLNFFKEGVPEAGCDEAGRGCLCGPVCAAAVVLPPDFHCPELNDSKQLSESKREELRPVIEREALAWAVAAVSAAEIDRINILKASILAMHRALARICVPDSASLFAQEPILSPGYTDNPSEANRSGDNLPEDDFSGDNLSGEHFSGDDLSGETYICSGGAADLEIEHIIVDGNRFRSFRDIPYTTIVKGDGKYMSIAAASVLAKTHRDAIMRCLAVEYPGYGWEQNMGYPTAAHIAALSKLGLTPHHRRTFAPCRTLNPHTDHPHRHP